MAQAQPVGPQALQWLRARMKGRVLEPGADGYDAARVVWNGRFDRHPAAIAQCSSPEDVQACVALAREHGLLLSVKSGGHDYAGNGVADGALTVDLSPLNSVRVEAGARRAWVQPGATWALVDKATQAHGLATPGGTVSTVGVAGFTLGGGSGHLTRKFGLALDNVVSFEVVTADGRALRARENENPDLFWALRGGGGNFGIVTRFEFALHEFGPDMLCGQILYPFAQAMPVLRAYRDFMAQAPDKLTCYAFVIRIPPIEAFPPALHDQVVVDLVFSYAGPVAEGEKATAALRAFGQPVLEAVQTLPYTAVQQMFDAGMPKGLRWYSRAHYLSGLPDAVFEAIVEHTRELPGAFTMVYVEPLGGAVGRVDPAATAFPHRRAVAGIHIFPGWSDPADDQGNMRWARAFHDAMAPFSTGGVYVNLLGDDEAARVPAAYGENYQRLAQLKRQWDPQNLFRVNHNVAPAK